jgi:protein AroM
MNRIVTLGTITIGQAPRSDITPILSKYLPSNVKCSHVGLLDGLTRAEITQDYSPEEGAPTLVSRLLDGSSVVVSKSKVRSLMNKKIDALQAQGCSFILLLCTGEFEDLASKGTWLLEPDRIVSPCVAAIAGDRQVGVVVPLVSQVKSEGGKWNTLAKAPICAAASPYADGTETLESAARNLCEQGAELLVLDCMGYVEMHRDVAARASGLPVILSNTLIGRMTAELVA